MDSRAAEPYLHLESTDDWETEHEREQQIEESIVGVHQGPIGTRVYIALIVGADRTTPSSLDLKVIVFDRSLEQLPVEPAESARN